MSGISAEAFADKVAKFGATDQGKELARLSEEGQKPSVIVVTCADSRVAPEVLTGAGVGELFVIRVAGNVIGPYELASIEFAAAVLGSPLCLVVGHSKCGAVAEAVDCVTEGRKSATPALNQLVEQIAPAVKSAQGAAGDDRDRLVTASIDENAKRSADQLVKESTVLADLVKRGKLTIKPALLDMKSSTIRYL